MNRRTKWIATGAVAAAALAVGSGIALASGADDEEPPIPQGDALDRATAVALKETGGGKVTGSEQEDGGYEIEVTLDDGSVVDVELDGDFKIIGSESDSESDEGSEADNEANEGTEDEANEGPDASDE
jgi:hypothetical protein